MTNFRWYIQTFKTLSTYGQERKSISPLLQQSFSNIFANIAFAIGFYWAKAIVGKQLSFDLENQYKQ